MIGTTLQDGLNALLPMFPGVTGAQIRAVWDKLQAGGPIAEGERRIAVELCMNRVTLDALRAMEEAPVRTQIEASLDAAFAVNADDIAEGEAWLAANGSGTLTAAILSNAVRYLVRVVIRGIKQRNGIIRLLRRKLDSTAGVTTR